MQIEGMEYLQKPRIQKKLDEIRATSDESSQMLLIKALFREIQQASKSVVDELDSGVSITNFDEVTTALHNETKKNTKLLLEALKDLKFSQEKQAEISRQITKDSQVRSEDDFHTIKIKKPRDKVTVTNLEDIPIAEEIRVTNLEELVENFKSLERVIESALKISIPAPQVNVEAPVINIPETILPNVNIDLESVIESLNKNLNKLRTNNTSNPVFVRMTDLDRLVDKLDEIRKASRDVAMGFPGAINLRDINGGMADPDSFGASVSTIANGLGDGSQSVTTAGTRVQLITASTPCRWVTVVAKSANTDSIYCGGSTISSSRGRPLLPLQAETFYVKNVNAIYIDSVVNGEGVTFVYGT